MDGDKEADCESYERDSAISEDSACVLNRDEDSSEKVEACTSTESASGETDTAVELVVTPTMAGTVTSSAQIRTWNLLAWPLRRKLRVLWAILVTGILCGLPVLIWDMQEKKWAPHYQAWFISGLFCLLTIPVTLYEIALHLEYYSQPQLQKHIIRILLMPPIYALDAWFCLRFADARTWLTPIRESYEAYTIYNFFMYLIRFLEGELGPVEEYLARSGKQHAHYFPFNLLFHEWPMGKEFYQGCRKGVLNYVILRPATTAAMFVALITNPRTYEEGKFAWDNLWPYTSFINNVSQGWALYCLMLFYVAMHAELAPIHPLRKIITIKLVVFFSFWQGFVITVLAMVGVLRVRSSWRTYGDIDTADLAGGLQDFIICIEMFAAALAFAWSFPPRDYMGGGTPGFWTTLHTLLDFRDVVDDVQGRVHEEYKDITTRPLSKIIAPIRNNPLFSSRLKPFAPPADEEIEPLRSVHSSGSASQPLAGGEARSGSGLLAAPPPALAESFKSGGNGVELALVGGVAKAGAARGHRSSKHQD